MIVIGNNKTVYGSEIFLARWSRGRIDYLANNIFFFLQCNRLPQEMGSKTLFSNEPVAEYGDVLILSVKPQVVPKVLPELKDPKKLVLSIAMGISLDALEKVTIELVHLATAQ